MRLLVPFHCFCKDVVCEVSFVATTEGRRDWTKYGDNAITSYWDVSMFRVACASSGRSRTKNSSHRSSSDVVLLA